MTDVIDAVQLRFRTVEGNIKRRPGATDAIASESPPTPSPTALTSLKCKRSVYRKSILKYLKMRCSILLIASSKAEKNRKATVSIPN
jgi:hypothetical protein